MGLSQVNKILRASRGATMIELMAMLAILGLGIGSMFTVVVSGIHFAKDTEDTIKAINLAREGIEGVTNIRNTNWLRYSSDRTNCWKISDYQGNLCIGQPGNANTHSYSGYYTLYTQKGLWYLSGAHSINPNSNWQDYSQQYQVIQDSAGLSTQTGGTYSTCSSLSQKNCRVIFTRQLVVSPDPTNSGAINIKSIVHWNTKRLQKVELQSTLTNWKSKF